MARSTSIKPTEAAISTYFLLFSKAGEMVETRAGAFFFIYYNISFGGRHKQKDILRGALHVILLTREILKGVVAALYGYAA